MPKTTNQKQAQPQTGKATEGFFRNIEIEFLIHELKDPISIIETGLRTLLEKQEKFGVLSDRQVKTLKRSLRNSKKARAMLDNLLEIGRSEAGCFICCRFQPAQAAYTAMLEALETAAGAVFEKINSLREQKEVLQCLSGNGIRLNITPPVSQVEMFQDETKFRQIVGNLIKNALHHRQHQVTINLELEHDCLVTEVSDDGPGVAPEHHKMIFQRYAQVKECSIAPRKGHGLGLAGALILARCLGGDIELQSEKGEGATFRLRLPLRFENQENSGG